MTTKEAAKSVIDKLSDEADMDEIIHAWYIKAKFDHGLRQIDEGKGIPHDKAKEMMQKWVK